MDPNWVEVEFTIRLPLDLSELLARDCEDRLTKKVDVIQLALREYYERRGLLSPQSK